MEFKKDKTYSFSQIMAYGFSRDQNHIIVDCHLYLGDNSFDGILTINQETFQNIIKRSDDKSGKFEQVALDWFANQENEIFLPDVFPEPVHCKLTDIQFHFIKSELDEDEFGEERIFYFSLEAEKV